MILFKGKNQDCNIIKSLEKEFGIIFHPKSTLKVVEQLKESYGTNHSKISEPKQSVLQNSSTRVGPKKEAD